MKWLYLLINIGTIFIPFIFSYHKKLLFNKNFKAFFVANFIVAKVFILWDIYFTHIGVWSFNAKYTLGLNLINLPIEEVLFFICIPFACVFTYHCLTLFYQFNWFSKNQNIITKLLSTTLLIIAILSIHKIYTATTFISLAFLLLFFNNGLKVTWLGNLYGVYLVLLVPFLIVNGILTGTFLAEPIVSYNNAENLGLRILTIPVEDSFYGFELILLNTYLYHYFLQKFGSTK